MATIPELLNGASYTIRLPNPERNGKYDPFHQPLLPNEWFSIKFPDQTRIYGSAFLEGRLDTPWKLSSTPLHPNEDFFASILGGNRRLGHQVVYHPSENTFYFYDYRVDAFCPVSEAKLKVLLSNFMIRCAQDCPSWVEVDNLVVAFRKDELLTSIVDRARAILEVEMSFFEGPDGNRRLVDGLVIHPDAVPSHQQFFDVCLVSDPAARVTVNQVFDRYRQFCKEKSLPALGFGEFKKLAIQAIRNDFELGIRHDIVGDNGKIQHGWAGVDCVVN